MVADESNELTTSRVAWGVWRDFQHAWRGLLVFEAIFKMIEGWVLVPAVALLLHTVLAQGHRSVVSNHEILDFLSTPLGILYASLFGALAIAARLIEQAGVMLVTTQAANEQRLSLAGWLRTLLLSSLNIVKLGAAKLLGLAFTFAPFVVLAALTYWALLTQHDIYFYWKDRPPIFWIAVSIGVLLLACAATFATWLYVRWSLALPIVLFERKLAHAALRISRQRIRGFAWRVAGLLLGWQVVSLLITALVSALYRQVAVFVLGIAAERSTWLILLLLIGQALVLAAVSFVVVVGQALLTRRLYLLRSPPGLGVDERAKATTTATANADSSPTRWAYLALGFVLVSPLGVWIGLTQTESTKPWVQITAHRGHARAAPENTLSAIRKAIDSGADYAEIDVQLTADGQVVLLHDRDFMRVSGDRRRLADLTLAEVEQLDVGSWFSPEFAGERVPNLAEVMELARGRIKLNIELKYYAPDAGLAQAVAAEVAHQHFTHDALVTSFDYAALHTIRQQNPQQRVGIIVAHSIGDLGRLEVDAISVRADHLSPTMLHAAHLLQREVHVWTVNDPAAMSRWIWEGVDNLITSDPDLAVVVRQQWVEASEGERLLHASRVLLGI